MRGENHYSKISYAMASTFKHVLRSAKNACLAQMKLAMSLNSFLRMLGTWHFVSGYPTTSKIYGFSLSERPHNWFRKPMGLGVCVKVARPAWCNAAIKNPVAIETDSGT